MEEINISEYILVILRRWKFVFAVGILAALIAVVALLLLPRTFRGQATLIFPKTDQSSASGILSKLAGLGGILDSGLSTSGGPGMYSEILKSRTLSDQVIKDLQLDGLLEAEDLQQSIDINVSKDGGMSISCYAPTNLVRSGKLSWVDKECQGKNEGQKTAYLAAEITNSYIKRLREFDRQHSLSTGRRNRTFLEQEVTKNRDQLAEAEESLRIFREKHPTLPLPDTGSRQLDQIVEIRTKQIEAEAELKEVGNSVGEAVKVANGQQAYETAARVIQESRVVTELKSQLAQAEVERAQLLENMTDAHPYVVAASQSVDKLKEKIAKEVAHVTASETLQINPVRQAIIQQLAGFQIRRSGVEARITALDSVMTRVEEQLSDMAKDQMQFVRLVRDVKALELVYTSLLTQLSQAKVAEAKEPDGFTVLDWAVPEKKHFKPKRTVTVIATFMLGLMVGCCLALLHELKQPAKRKSRKEAVGV